MSRRPSRLFVTLLAAVAGGAIAIPSAAAKESPRPLKPPVAVTVGSSPDPTPFAGCDVTVSITGASRNATYTGTVVYAYMGLYAGSVQITTDRLGNGSAAPVTVPGSVVAVVDGVSSGPAGC